MAENEDLRFPEDFLKIEEIYLWDSKFERHADYQPAVHDGKVHVQSKRGFEAEVLKAEAADGETDELFRVKVSLGIRAVTSGDEEEPLHSVEATFAVEYRITAPLPDAEMPDFIMFNSAHNVWPFWREHVYTTLQSASLPVLHIPFFSGSKKKDAGKGKRQVAKKP